MATLASITVTTLMDVDDGTTTSISDLIANPGADGEISLREAIIAANADATINTIILGSGIHDLSITGGGDKVGDLNINSDIEIIGAADGSTTVDATGLSDRVFNIDDNANAVVSNLTVTGGSSNSGGGGFFVTAGASLSLDNTIVADNEGSQGGGIRNLGTIEVSNSSIIDNTATSSGGGISTDGVALFDNVIISNNESNAAGGGIRNHDTLTATNLTIANNIAGGSGGGISSNGNLTSNTVTVSGNQSDNTGGGLHINGASHVLQNTTVSGNSSTSNGGGIYVNSVTVILGSATVTDNSATGSGGGVYLSNSAGLNLTNSILAGNTVGNSDIELRGDILSGGSNIIGNDAGDSAGGSGYIASDLQDQTGLLLGPLADNGGPVQTHALLAGSVGIDPDGPDVGAFESDTAANDLPLSPNLSTATIDENSANGTVIDTVTTTGGLSNATGITSILDSDPSLEYFPATGKFYKAVGGNFTWVDANSEASATNLNGVTGQLVTIRSQEENDFIQGLASSQPTPEDVWIGASDQIFEGDWHWYADGNQDNNELFFIGDGTGSAQPGFYTNWKNSDGIIEPTAGLADENFGRLTQDTGEWRDTTSTVSTNSYVVEWDAAEVIANHTFTLTDDANGRFAIDSITGDLTVADGSKLNFESDITHNVTIEVSSLGGVASEEFAIAVNNVNEEPEFESFGSSVDYITGSNAVVLDADATVVDPELTLTDNFDGSQLHILRQGGANVSDQFSATGLLNPLAEGDNVIYNGVIVGTATTVSGGELLITFNGNASNADVNGVLQSIAYENTNSSPEASVNLAWTFNDGNLTDQGSGGSQSTTGVMSVRIIESLDVDENSVNGTSIGFVQPDDSLAIAALQAADPSLVYDNITQKFYRLVLAPENFSDALAAATTADLNGINGQLLTIRSPYENAIARSIAGPDQVWLGATDLTVEGEWHWLDGNVDADQFWSAGSTVSGYSNWDATEPNNSTAPLASGEDAAVLGINGGWFDWSDWPTHTLRYIVEWDVADILASQTYTLTDDSNGRFAIDSNTGEVSVADGSLLDFETETAHNITVEINNGGGTVVEQVVPINVNNINDAPLLDNSANLNLSTIAENNFNPAGDTVANIVASGGLNSITDVDIGAVEGIAVFAVDDTNGTWQYLPDGETAWISIGAVDTASALLLDPDAMIRFVPDPGFTGTAKFFFHAWDQTQGVNGQSFDISNSATGTSTAFSLNSDDVTISINPVNNSPMVTQGTGQVNEGEYVTLTNAMLQAIDPDDSSSDLTYTVSNITNGQFEFSGTAGVAITSFTQQQLDTAGIVFLHNGSETLTASFDFSLADGGENGATPATGTFTFNVIPINDAPLLAAGSNPVLNAITEDNINNDGETVSSLLATIGNPIADNDPSALEGIAIFANNGNGGQWQYSIDNGTNWQNVGAVSNSSALLLRDTDLLRMNPNEAFGHNGNLGFRAWDQTISTAGTKVDIPALGSTGGTSAFSTNTLSAQITVADINDDPTNPGGLPVAVTVTEDLDTTIDFSSLDLMDVDENGQPMTVRLTTDTGGIINLTPQSVIDISNNGTGQVTLTSALGFLNNYLNYPDNISYLHSTANTFGTNADKIRVEVSDNGNTGAGGGNFIELGFANVNITAVNDTPIAINDNSYVTNEDTALNVVTGGILDNDTDVDDALAITQLTSTSNGALTLHSDGTFDYVPDANFTGSDSFTYQLVDPSGASSQIATVTITVNPVADAPVATADAFNTDEDITLTGNVLVNDTDADGDALSVTATPVADPINGSVQLNADGSFTYTPNANYFGTDSFTYEVSDGNGGSNTAVVNITVDSVNDAPVAIADAFNTDEDVALTANVLGNDIDADGDVLSINTTPVADPINGSVQLNADGTFTYAPDTGFHGTDSFTYEISDGNGGSNTAAVNITVGSVNDSPVAVADTFNTNEDFAFTANVLSNDTDADGDVLSINPTPVADPINGSVQLNADGTFTYTPNANYFGPDSFTYEVNDGNGGSNTAAVNITIDSVNDSPVAVADTFNTDEDTALTANVLGNDTDADGDALSVNTTPVAGPTNGSVQLNADGTFAYTPNAHYFGSDSFSYEVSDGNGGRNTATVSINIDSVNDPPVAVADTFNTDEDAALTANVLGNDTDADGDALSVNTTPVAGPTNGSVQLNADGTFAYTPNAHYFGSDSFSYEVSDGNGGRNTATVSINIDSVNDPPVAAADTFNTDEDAALTANVLGNDTDADGDVLSVNTTPVADPINGSVQLNVDGTFTYTPDTGFHGTDSFAYEVSDGNGGSNTATVNITVDSVNDAPVAVADTFNTNQGVALTASVLVNDTDADGDTLSVNATPVVGPTNGSVQLNVDGTFTYTPNAKYFGSDSFTYAVSDGNGGSNTATVNITVDSVNNAPVAVADTFNTDEDVAITANVLGNDTDEDGDVLSVNTTPVAGPGNGAVQLNADGTFTYTPNANYFGTDSFIYEVSDGKGGSNTATVNITIDSVNDAPVASADIFNTDEDTALTANVLGNDTDADADALSINTTPVSGPINGSVQLNADGTFIYTPDTGFHGTDSFTYEVSDGNGGSNTATVNITVDSINDAPVAVADAFNTDEDVALTANVLGNDTDVDGDVLSINTTPTVGPANGSVQLNTDGTFTYTPNTNFHGTDSFIYEVSDGNGGSNSATVNITVDSINDSPAAVADTFNTDEDIALTANVLGNDTDVDGDALSINTTPVVDPINGTVQLNVDGTFIYTPNTNYHGTDSFTYEVSDTNGGSNTVTVNIIINSVNDSPSGANSTVTTMEDTDFAFAVSDFNFTDAIDGNIFLAVTIDTTPANGQLLLDGTAVITGDIILAADIDAGLLMFQPGSNDSGTNYAEFSFRVQDDGALTNGGSDTDATSRTITINVTPINDAPFGTDNEVLTTEDTAYTLNLVDFGFTDNRDAGDQLSAILIDVLPTAGQLQLNGAVLNAGDTVTVNQLDAGQLLYIPGIDRFGINDAKFEFRVIDNNSQPGNAISLASNQLSISISSVSDAPTGMDSTLLTVEDTSYIFDTNDFGFEDPSDEDALIAVLIDEIPTGGTLSLNGVAVTDGDFITVNEITAGSLQYLAAANSNGIAYDALGFRVVDGGTDGTANTDLTVRRITIDVLAVNDRPELISNGATVLEGGTVNIDGSLLNGTDPDDTDPQELALTVTSVPLHGELMLNGEIVTAGTGITLAAIEAGALSYVHDESETSADGFNVSLTDGGEDGVLSTQGRFELSITEVIDAAVELNPDSLTLAFGESFDSAQGNLLTSGFSSLTNGGLSNNTDWLVELEVPPAQGTVELKLDGTFTYVHNGSTILQDEFTYRVTNEDGIFTIATVAITIEPPPAQPNQPAPEPDPEPETEPEPAIAPAMEENVDPVANIVPFPESVAEQTDIPLAEEATEKEVVQATTEQPQENRLAEVATPLFPENSVNEDRTGDNSTQVATQELPEVNTLQADFSTRESFEVTQHREVQGITYTNEPILLSAAIFELTLEVYVPSGNSASSNSIFLKQLAQVGDDFEKLEDQSGARYKLLEDTVLGASFSVTVGALAWALRGGALAASMMTLSPLWKFIEIDQISVTGGQRNPEDQTDDDPDDQVESLFDKSA